MYPTESCSVEGCPNSAFPGQSLCLEHLAEPLVALRDLVSSIRETGTAINLNLTKITLPAGDFSRVHFVGCCFRLATLSHLMFTGASFRLCFFDSVRINSCDFSGADMDFCSFGDADIFDTSFENSELIHVNFTGARIRESTFSSSNLYDSRFVQSNLDHCQFDDCDFKRA